MFDLSSTSLLRGTEGSNPTSSSHESSTNLKAKPPFMTASRRSGRLDVRGVGRNAERAWHLAPCGRRVARVKVGNRVAGTFHLRWFRGPIKAPD